MGGDRDSIMTIDSALDTNIATSESESKIRRSRKAKPLVTATAGEENEGGECTQS